MEMRLAAGLVTAARRTLVGGLAALLLTAVHHLYGAYVYDTPWRGHVAHVAGVTAAVLAGSYLLFRQKAGTVVGSIGLWVLALATVVLPVVGIGLFEGGYNHALKVALYLAGSSPETMRALFPPPTYELPNDVFFEVSGVLQLVLGLVAGRSLVRLWRER